MLYLIALFALGLFTIPALLAAFKQLQQQKQIAKIEESLPELLFKLSNLTNVSFEEFLQFASSTQSAAAFPFKKATELIKRGMPVELAITTSFASGSQTISKTGALLCKVYENGNSSLAILKCFAINLSKMVEAKKQAKADSSIQKYSILIAAAFLVPFIIAMISSIATKATVLLPQQNNPLSVVVILSIHIYLLLFSLLSAKFLARQFSTHFFAFFSITAPLAILVFNLTTLFFG